MATTPAIHRLDRLTNRIVDRRSTKPASRRFRAARLPRKVREVITAELQSKMEYGKDERLQALNAFDAAKTLPDDMPDDLLHYISDACLIPAYGIRREPSYRPGLSRSARLARQLYRVGQIHAQADAEFHDLPPDP